jgi:hypothetical protein
VDGGRVDRQVGVRVQGDGLACMLLRHILQHLSALRQTRSTGGDDTTQTQCQQRLRPAGRRLPRGLVLGSDWVQQSGLTVCLRASHNQH